MLPFRFRSLWRGQHENADAGTRGERLAEGHLRRQGLTLVARNWRNPADQREEIDLVMNDRGVLVFVEVKARSAHALVRGYFAVTRRKKKVLRRACSAYLRALRARPRTFRFDVVEVELPPEGALTAPVVRHFANVPLFRRGFR